MWVGTAFSTHLAEFLLNPFSRIVMDFTSKCKIMHGFSSMPILTSKPDLHSEIRMYSYRSPDPIQSCSRNNAV